LTEAKRFGIVADMANTKTVHGEFIARYEAAAKRLRGKIRVVTESRILREMRRAEERAGTCLCGHLIANHFTASNRKLSCEQVGRNAELPKEAL